MGIESDQLVYDYLSRVGDLAQSTLPAARRRELVTQLRQDIDRQRRGSDSPAAVRRILGRIGSPDEVVEAAARRPEPPRREEPEAPRRPRPEAPPAAAPSPGPSVPLDKTPPPGPDARPPEWWRVDTGPRGSMAARANGALAGWSGGLEIPFDDEDDADDAADSDAAGATDGSAGAGTAGAPRGGQGAGPAAEQAAAPGRRLRLPWPLGRRAAPPAAPPEAAAAAAAVPGRRGLPVGPVELVAALALVAGVVLRSWLPLGIGWAIAYGSRRLSRAEAKWAVLGLPGLVAVGALVWLWGRLSGHWGQPVPGGQVGPVIVAGFPVVVRVAAIASALFLVWRGARRTP